jgi:hypothetical protein
MAQAPRWTVEELDRLLDALDHSDELLSEELSGRSADAVSTMRTAIHEFHRSPERPFARSGLSVLVRQRLYERSGTLTCYLCGSRF